MDRPTGARPRRDRPTGAPPLRTTAAALLILLPGCDGASEGPGGPARIVFSGSAVGREAELVRSQLGRFMAENPDVMVEVQATPDAADQRHQLYVQWLNARVGEPDVLQLDVIWTPEFAAAGWILPLDSLAPERGAFFPATLAANSWNGRLYALPWFVDVGMLYWRTDLLDGPPATLEELARMARARDPETTPYGFVWQGARYEGLVTVFLEHLGAFGGEIVDEEGRVAVARAPAVDALRFMTAAVAEGGWVPSAVLAWREEQTRFAFQNGQALFMRNWPYAYSLLADRSASEVAGRFAVAPLPVAGAVLTSAPNAAPTAALGGAQLAVNARSRHPDAARRVVEYLTRPDQMLERARVLGQYPSRPDLYDDPRLAEALPVPAAEARRVIERARPRPVIPVYTELSTILQIWLHRALTGQRDPAMALAEAAREIERLLERVRLAPTAVAGATP